MGRLPALLIDSVQREQPTNGRLYRSGEMAEAINEERRGSLRAVPGFSRHVTLHQNFAVNSTPNVRGSLRKPVRLLKSIAPTTRTWSVRLRPYTATSYWP